jgi:hypothetical protein
MYVFLPYQWEKDDNDGTLLEDHCRCINTYMEQKKWEYSFLICSSGSRFDF